MDKLPLCILKKLFLWSHAPLTLRWIRKGWKMVPIFPKSSSGDWLFCQKIIDAIWNLESPFRCSFMVATVMPYLSGAAVGNTRAKRVENVPRSGAGNGLKEPPTSNRHRGELPLKEIQEPKKVAKSFPHDFITLRFSNGISIPLVLTRHIFLCETWYSWVTLYEEKVWNFGLFLVV